MIILVTEYYAFVQIYFELICQTIHTCISFLELVFYCCSLFTLEFHKIRILYKKTSKFYDDHIKLPLIPKCEFESLLVFLLIDDSKYYWNNICKIWRYLHLWLLSWWWYGLFIHDWFYIIGVYRAFLIRDRSISIFGIGFNTSIVIILTATGLNFVILFIIQIHIQPL